jgi:hypothetical protein
MAKQLRATGLVHKLKWYAENYGLPLQTIINARNRDWPLDNPRKLLEKLIHAPGPKCDVQALIDFVDGKASPRQRANPSPTAGSVRVTLTIGGMVFSRFITAAEADAIIQLEGAWESEALEG